MKKILFKLFPIMGEEIPESWMEEDSLEYKMAKTSMFVGIIFGSSITIILIKILENI